MDKFNRELEKTLGCDLMNIIDIMFILHLYCKLSSCLEIDLDAKLGTGLYCKLFRKLKWDLDSEMKEEFDSELVMVLDD